MNTYLILKLVHLLSATILFGTGLGTAFLMLRAYISRDTGALSVAARYAVVADWAFTTPAVVIQLITGVWLSMLLGISFTSPWFLGVIGLYFLVGACWLPVVAIQIRIRDLVDADHGRERYAGLMRVWIGLGVVAFSAVLAIFFLMVTKIGAYVA